ncbi:LysR family transcriptional regulator [Mycobacterium sp. NPDC004974]
MRTFVVAAELGQFQVAADELSITPQAVSKRVAALERALGTALFVRTAHGVRLSADGESFLPHARELLRAAERAWHSVRSQKRVLRVDVTHRRIAPSVVFQDFHVANPSVRVEVVTLLDNNLTGALSAVQSGTIDASFRAVTLPSDDLPRGVVAARAIDHELEVLVGPEHSLAAEDSLTPSCLRGFRIWIPGIVPGAEWAVFYDDLARAFGLSIDSHGPHFGDEALLERLRDDPSVATLVGRRDRYFWPAQYGLRRIPLRDPTPIYPHSLIWLTTNSNPGLAALRAHLSADRRTSPHEPNVWLPRWAASVSELGSDGEP